MTGRVAEEAEVVVVGGGPSGSVAAAKLAEQGHDVLLIDQSGFPRDKPCGDGLTHASVAFLQRHGMDEAVERSQVIEDVRAVIGHERLATGFYRPWPQPPQYARVMQRRGMDNGLFEIAMAQGARFLEARVDRPLLKDGTAQGVALTGPDGDIVKARCVIAADGATSRMRRTSGFDRERRGSHIYALRQYATTSVALDPVYDFHLPLFYEGGLLAGYGWVFPVSEHRANIGVAYYEPPPGRPKARIRDVLDSFLGDLKQRSAERIGDLSDPSEPIGAPIATQFSAERCELGNLIFTGEAARAADGLNGEGISFALQSGEFAAEEAHRLLSGKGAPAQGKRIARRFARLGADMTWPARLVAAAPTGLTLVDPEHQPFMHRVRRVLGFGLDDPLHARTEVRARLEQADPGSAADLDRANERILDSLDSGLPFTVETMHREARAEDGPFAAALVIAAANATGGEGAEPLARTAAAYELVSLVSASYAELSDRTTSDLARLSNTLAILTGQLVLGRGLENGSAASPEVGAQVAGAARAAIESLAHALDRDDLPLAEEHLSAGGGLLAAIAERAARSGAALGGANGSSDALAAAGRELGFAWQIGNEIRDLTTGDETAGRPPGAVLRSGAASLPLIYAADRDPALAGPDNGDAPKRGREVLAAIRASGGIEDAAQECARRVEAARAALDGAGVSNPEPMHALASLCMDRLEPAAAAA
jgi:menaquinone-9 beta-reductase